MPPLPTMVHSSSYLLPSPPAPPASSDADADNALSYAVVVLNQRLPRFAPLLWTRAQLRVCADGGANRLFDGMPELLPAEDPDEVRARYKPDAIEGDMDSVRPEVKEYYSSLVTTLKLLLAENEMLKLATEPATILHATPVHDGLYYCMLVMEKDIMRTKKTSRNISFVGHLGPHEYACDSLVDRFCVLLEDQNFLSTSLDDS